MNYCSALFIYTRLQPLYLFTTKVHDRQQHKVVGGMRVEMCIVQLNCFFPILKFNIRNCFRNCILHICIPKTSPTLQKRQNRETLSDKCRATIDKMICRTQCIDFIDSLNVPPSSPKRFKTPNPGLQAPKQESFEAGILSTYTLIRNTNLH